MEEKEDLKLNIHYSAIQGSYWIMVASITVFLVAFLREKGFDGFQIGSVLAVRALATITIQPIIASFADRHAAHIPLKYIMGGMLGICLFANLFLILVPLNYIGTLAVFIVFGGTENSLAGFNDSLAMQFYNAGRKINYSLGRGIGSFSYAVVCIALGYYVDAFGLISLPIIHVVFLIFYFIIMITFEHNKIIKTEPEKEDKPYSIFYLFRINREFTLFLLASMLIFTGSNMSTSFLIEVVEKLGGQNKDMGFTIFVLAASELPMALLFSRIKLSFGIKRILKFSSFFIFIKILCIIFAPNIAVLILTQSLQMLGYGAYLSASVFFVNENISGSNRVKGQSLLQISTMGFGVGVGSLLSGVLVNNYGLDCSLYTAAIIAFIGVLIMFVAMRNHKKHNFTA